MQYNNVGVYHICRKLKGHDDDYFRREAHADLHLLTDPEWKSVTVYMDEAEIGSRCGRAELNRMFSNAAAGILDHIRIHSYFDLWHDAKTTMDAINKLWAANPTIGISFHSSAQDRYPNRPWDKCLPFDRLAHELMELQRMDGELRFLQEFYYQISPALRIAMLQYFIDPYKLENFLEFFYLEPKGMELEDLVTMLGLPPEDIALIKFCAEPSDDSYAKILEWIWQDLLAYFLV